MLPRDIPSTDEKLPPLTHADEERLAQEPFLATLFYLIAKGHPPHSLQADFKLNDAEMNRYLKTAKREIIHNRIKDLAIVEQVVQMKVTRDASVDDGLGSEHRTWDAAGDELIEY